MPPVEGCTKQDYAVLIVIGLGVAFVACLGLIVFGWFQWQRETNRKLAAFHAASTDTPAVGVDPTAPAAPIAAPVAVTPVVATSQAASAFLPIATAPIASSRRRPSSTT